MIDQSILTSVKKGIGGIIEEDEAFDDEIIMHINSVLAKLTQLGIGPKSGFHISDKTATWADFFGNNDCQNFIQSFVILSVRLLFDPPTIGAVAQAMEKQRDEYEWRIREQAEFETSEEERDDPDDTLSEYPYE